ncbi:MAG: DUF1553 domain-containing protein [Verrucomicrobiota bacterium]
MTPDQALEIPGLDKSLTLRANARFTISLWVRPRSLDDSVIIARQKGGSTRPGVEIALVDGGKVQFDLIARWISSLGRVTSTEALLPDVWTHLTITNDGSQSANGQRIFFDGIEVGTEVTHNTNSNVGGVSEKEPLRLGHSLRPGARRFDGTIRDVRLYSAELWHEEIAALGRPLDSPERLAFAALKDSPEHAGYISAREGFEKYESSLPTVMVMEELPQPKPTFVRDRGVYNDYGDRVDREVPEVLPPMDASLPRDRLGFAKWLVSGEHPLTARVAVNRHWQRFFGIGLVKTSEDFGVQGEAPSHPELLDWLAVEFVESGWDVQALQRLILTSETYRQRSVVTPEHLEKDPDNRLLARAPRLRLTGQAIRDQALAVSGLLVEKSGGPSVSPYQPANLWAEMSMGRKYKQSKGDDLYRRSLYTIWKRTVAPPAMAVFDAADREACWVSRKETNTPLQALTVLNETGFVESARHLAARMLREGGDDPIGLGFRLVASRVPTVPERAVFDSALTEYRQHYEANPEAASKMIAVGESPVDDTFPPLELATFSAVANVLLNLDETITRQ